MAPWLTTIGLVMDILGILLLYRYGAIGGSWIDAPMPKIIDIVSEEHTAGPAHGHGLVTFPQHQTESA